MSFPFTHNQTVWDAKALTDTQILETHFRACPYKVVEVVTAGFTGTLDIKGAIGGNATVDNLRYVLMGQQPSAEPTNAQLSYTTSTSRFRYLILEHTPITSLVMTRSAGTISCNVYGIEGPIPSSPSYSPGTPTVYNVAVTNADTEYSQALPANTKKFTVKLRDATSFRLAFATGKVATPVEPYLSVNDGFSYSEEKISAAAITLYFAAPVGTKTAEIVAWA